MDANSFTDPYLLAYNEDETDSSYETNDLSISSPRLINININNKLIKEITSFFKIDNLFICVQKDENVDHKKNISISKIIMDTVIDKKLGTITYYYGNRKSSKAYHTYDYPEIYYDKKLYNNVSQWLKEEFSKQI